MTYPSIVMHQDRPVTSASFRDQDALWVTSVFRTIQSEGPYAGHPAMFVRLAGCNYGDKKNWCAFCDTDFRIDSASHYSAESLLAKMTAEGWQLNDVVVFTGGEPTLQHYLLDVIVALRSRNRHATVQLETNGTQASFFVKANTPEYRDHCHMSVVCSPKAGPKGYVELSPTVLVEVEALKFVVSADEGPHHEIPEWALDIRRGARNVLCDVYVSPMAQYLRAYDGEVSSIWDDTLIDKPRTSANYSYAAAYALKHNLRLSLQGHLFCALP